jgi:SAM-dependent methyltransferase
LRACPICQANAGREIFNYVRGYTIVACGRCTGWYLSEAGRADYGEGYLRRGEDGGQASGYFDYEGERALHLRNFARNLEILGEFADGGALCDVGCASGHFLMAAQRSGKFSSLCGVDVSAGAVEKVREAVGCPGFAGEVETMAPPGQFDVVTMWETIEHIERPVEALSALRGWLRPGGLLAIGTGDNASPLARALGRRWWYLVPPDHCVYFNKVALATALGRAGYEVVGWRRIFLHWVSAANVAMKLLRSLEVAPERAVAAGRYVGKVPLPIVHGTTIVALARPRR